MKNIQFSVNRSYSCDVLVVGGGVAGISAAICAARGGANVILAERDGCLGGTASVGLVGPFMSAMDQMMVDVTDVPGVVPGDEVMLLGRQGDACITADELGAWSGTIGYEVLLAATDRVHRIWLNDDV